MDIVKEHSELSIEGEMVVDEEEDRTCGCFLCSEG
jgi:hypothetical protein